MKIYEVRAHWDPDARVWWAESDDVTGLVAEAETLEALIEDLKHLVPELLSLNNAEQTGAAAVRIYADRQEAVSISLCRPTLTATFMPC